MKIVLAEPMNDAADKPISPTGGVPLPRSFPKAHCGGASFRALMDSFFTELGKRNVRYLVLRNYETLPDEATNDVDILVSPNEERQGFDAIKFAAEQTGWAISNVGRFSCLSVFLFCPDTLEQTHVDLMPGNRWHSFSFADDDAMLGRRVPFKQFFVPAQPDESWISFATRLLYGGYVKRKYRPKIQAVCKEKQAETMSVFAAILGRRFARKVVSLCAAGDWDAAESLAGKVRRRTMLLNAVHPFSFSVRVFHDGLRFLDRFLSPPGLVVGLAGEHVAWRDEADQILRRSLLGTFYPKKTFRWNVSEGRSLRSRIRKNSFHGGLSIIDIPFAPAWMPRCDIIFSDKSIRLGRCHVFGMEWPDENVIAGTVLEFLRKRTEVRIAR